MLCGVYVPTFGEYDLNVLVDLARESEAAGWDGFFIWDHLLWAPVPGAPLVDTTAALTAIALATDRVRFGALVTPIARRRPWKLAKEAASLDHLSGGRLVLGVGVGGNLDVFPVGEEASERQRAALLDEGLEVVTALWSGEPVTHAGPHFHLEAALMRPTPLQRPRIPIWVAGFWPSKAPFRRAARWDGALPLKRGHLLQELTPEELRDCARYIRDQRGENAAFDLVAFAVYQKRTAEVLAEYEEAGATWWVEAVNPLEQSLAAFRKQIAQGPPR